MDAYNAMRADPDYIEIVGQGHFMSRETFARYGAFFEPYAGERERRFLAAAEMRMRKSRLGNAIRAQKLRERMEAKAAAAAAEQV